MKLIIDSGATKSEFLLLRNEEPDIRYKTAGININYCSDSFISTVFESFLAKYKCRNKIFSLFYYGAGCLNPANAERVKLVLQPLFPKAEINVFSDLMISCHALCNDQKGYVGILGTGSASCNYDGKQIVDSAPSLGFMLGDEGSGTHLGRLFIQAYLRKMLSKKLVKDFETKFEINQNKVFAKIYQEPFPQCFFASIPPFLLKNIKNKDIFDLCCASFSAFFFYQKQYYQQFHLPWYLSGSIAYYFKDIILQVAQRKSVGIRKIIQNPIEEF